MFWRAARRSRLNSLHLFRMRTTLPLAPGRPQESNIGRGYFLCPGEGSLISINQLDEQDLVTLASSSQCASLQQAWGENDRCRTFLGHSLEYQCVSHELLLPGKIRLD